MKELLIQEELSSLGVRRSRDWTSKLEVNLQPNYYYFFFLSCLSKLFIKLTPNGLHFLFRTIH